MFMTGVLCTICGAQVYFSLQRNGMTVSFETYQSYNKYG